MKIYGRSEQDDSQITILAETTVVAEPETLRELASFLYRCADAIEEQGDSWEHDSFESNDAVSPELVVFNPNVVNF